MNNHLVIESLTKSYSSGKPAVNHISFEVGQGEFVAIIGPSGAGKSTILRCINRMVDPTEGRIIFEGNDISHVKGRKMRDARRKIGMIFQHYNLSSRLTVMHNVMHGRLGYMSTMAGVFNSYREADKHKAIEYLAKVGLLEQMYKRASDLSGGQKQRVGIVRALMQQPSLLLCDEPIASLDPNSAKVIMDLIRDLTREENISCIVNLHQVQVAKEYATRIIGIRQGKMIFNGSPSMLSNQIIEEIYDTSIDNLMINGEVQAVVV